MNRKEKEKRQIRYSDAKKVAEKQQSGFEPTSIQLPPGTPLFSFKREGLFTLDVIPFFTKKGNPMCDEDMLHWERTYWAHGGVGAENKRYSCLRRTFGKKCPICDHAITLRKQGGDPELIKQLESPSKRQLIAIIDYSDRDKGIQVYEGPYYFGLGELIDNKVEASSEDSTYRDWFHLDKGSKLIVKAKQESFQGRSFFKPVNVEMEVRKKPLSEHHLDAVPCLDDLPKELSYDKLKDIFLQAADVEETKEEEKPSRVSVSVGGKSPIRNGEEDPDDDEEEPDEDEGTIKLGSRVYHKTYGVCDVVKPVVKDKTTIVDDEEESHSVSVDSIRLATKEDMKKKLKKEEPEDEDDEPEEYDHDEDKADEDDDEDEDDEDEEPEPEPVKPPKKPGTKPKK